jgi:hypothetical protein
MPLGSSIADELLESARRASRQSKHVLMAIQIFSILLATMLWNSHKWNWTDSRVRIVQIAQLLLTESKCADEFFWKSVDPKRLEPIAKEWAACFQSECKKEASVFDTIDIVGAAEFLLDRRYDEKSLRKFLDKLEEFRFRDVATFPIPLSGVRVDVNGLGFVSGIGFVVLLAWFYLGLKRERENLSLVLKHFGEPGIDLLRMESFFNPETSSEAKTTLKQRVGRILTIIAIVFPAALLLFIIINDLSTLFRGQYVSKGMTTFTTILEGVTFTIAGFFIYLSASECSAISSWWRRHQILKKS